MPAEPGASPPLALSFTLRDAERVAVRRYLGRWRWRTAAVTGACVAGVAALVALDGVHNPWIRGLAAGGGVVAGLGAAWRLPALQVRRVGAASAERLTLGPTGIVHEVGEVRSDVPWSAVTAIVDLAEGWLLTFSAGQGLLVPRRVAPAGFGARAEAWRAGDERPSGPVDPPEGHRTLTATYHATEADYLAFARRLARRRRPVWAMPAGAFVVLVVALAADRGLDPVALVALALWAGALVASGAAQRVLGRWLAPGQVRRALRRDPQRLPSGPVAVGLGPLGGWLHHAGGETRFAWQEVLSIHADDAALVVLFGDDVGLVLPARAFPDAEAMSDAARAMAIWRDAGTNDAAPKRDRGVVPGPFAPPDPD